MPKRLTDEKSLQDFVDSLNRTLNTTVTQSRLTLWAGSRLANRRVTRAQKFAEPLPLELRPRGNFVFVLMTIRMEDSPRGNHIELENCSFRFSKSPDLREESAWVLRYDFSMNPEPGQPHAHLHVNAVHKHNNTPLERLHLPSGRVSLEQFLAHLLLEQGVEPIPDITVAEAMESLGEGHRRFPTDPTPTLFP